MVPSGFDDFENGEPLNEYTTSFHNRGSAVGTMSGSGLWADEGDSLGAISDADDCVEDGVSSDEPSELPHAASETISMAIKDN